MLHRKDRRKHREPLGVIFKYDGWEGDKDVLPIIPKKLDYTIRVFNQEIEDTLTDFPRVKPPRSEHEGKQFYVLLIWRLAIRLCAC